MKRGIREKIKRVVRESEVKLETKELEKIWAAVIPIYYHYFPLWRQINSQTFMMSAMLDEIENHLDCYASFCAGLDDLDLWVEIKVNCGTRLIMKGTKLSIERIRT